MLQPGWGPNDSLPPGREGRGRLSWMWEDAHPHFLLGRPDRGPRRAPTSRLTPGHHTGSQGIPHSLWVLLSLVMFLCQAWGEDAGQLPLGGDEPECQVDRPSTYHNSGTYQPLAM